MAPADLAARLTLEAYKATNLPRVLLVADLCSALRAAPGTVRRWCASGELPAARIGRRWVVSRDDLLDTIRKRAAVRLVAAGVAR